MHKAAHLISSVAKRKRNENDSVENVEDDPHVFPQIESTLSKSLTDGLGCRECYFVSSYARVPVEHWFVQHLFLSCPSLCPQDLAYVLKTAISQRIRI